MFVDRPADAVLIPESLKRGRRMAQRVASIADIVEPLLGCDRAKGEKAYLRRTTMTAWRHDNPRERTVLLFCTKNQHDTLKFPTGHPRHPEDRYRWVDDGLLRLGYLIARPEEEIGIYGEVPR